MFRFYLRLTLVLTCLLGVLFLVIRLTRHDIAIARELYAVLSPESCAAPCFLGIQPGTTLRDEALRLLQNHEWVTDVGNVPESPYYVAWTWNEDAPDFLQQSASGTNVATGNVLFVQGDIVSSMSFSTQITLGDVVVTWGIPDSTQVIYSAGLSQSGQSAPVTIALEYVKAGFWVIGRAVCPYTANFWNAPTRFTLIKDFSSNSFGAFIPLDRKTFYSGIFKLSRQACGN